MTRRTLLTLAGVCLLPRLSFAQAMPGDLQRGAWFLDVANVVNKQHPLAPSLWWLVLPQRTGGGSDWIDLCQNKRLLRVGMQAIPTAISGYQRGTTRVGGFGEARLDGISVSIDYFTMNKIPTLNLPQGTMVVSAYRSTAIGRICSIMSLGDGSAGGDNSYNLTWQDSTNNMMVRIRSGAADVMWGVTAGGFPIGSWYQLAFTVNAQGNRLYANGLPVTLSTYFSGSAATTAFFSTVYNAVTTFDVGRLNFTGSSALPGRVDDVRIYNRALTAKEVQALYTNTQLGYPGLLRRLPLNPAPAAVAAARKRPGGRIY